MQMISQMNKKLSELNSFFSQNTSSFIYSINLHQTKFTHKDLDDFQILISQIKKQVNQKINSFFNDKFRQRSRDYENKIEKYSKNAQQLQFQLFSFRNQLQRSTLALKEQEERKQIILQEFSKKFYLNNIKKNHFQAFKKNLFDCQREKQINQKADNIYIKNLLKKAFLPWRSLTYKDGYQNRVICQNQKDIQNIHTQYSSIINMLKQKIKDVDQQIKLKKAAKGQLSYALSKNLMKTISNLSLEVISLNQMTLQDGYYGNSKQQHQLMNQIDRAIDEKFKKIKQYKQNLVGQNNSRPKQKKTTFV